MFPNLLRPRILQHSKSALVYSLQRPKQVPDGIRIQQADYHSSFFIEEESKKQHPPTTFDTAGKNDTASKSIGSTEAKDRTNVVDPGEPLSRKSGSGGLIETSSVSEIIEQIKARAGFATVATNTLVEKVNSSKSNDQSSVQHTIEDKPGSGSSSSSISTGEKASSASIGSSGDSNSSSSSSRKLKFPRGDAISSTASNIGSNIGSTLNYAENAYEDFEKKVMRSINESNQRRFRIVLLSTLLVTVWIGVVFGDRIKKEASEQTAALAKETLENESLKIQTQELARAVVQTVLEDKDITAHAATFLKEASTAPETQQALLQLTLHILQHNDTLHELTKLSKRLLDDLSKDEEVIGQFGQLFAQVVEDPVLRNALVGLVAELCRDPQVMKSVTELTLNIIARSDVNEATSKLLLASSTEVLDDVEIKVQSRQFVADVMGDDLLQKEGGTALWNTVSHALKPGLFRIAGLTLITISLTLAKIVLTPY